MKKEIYIKKLQSKEDQQKSFETTKYAGPVVIKK